MTMRHPPPTLLFYRSTSLSFYAAGHSHAAKTASDAWLNMLEQIRSVTPPVSKAITAAFSTCHRLYFALQQIQKEQGQAAAEALLSTLHVKHDNTTATKTLGSALSRRLFQIFTHDNPALVIQ